MAPRVFLITGTSTGFGEELVKVVLQKGDHVVATARNSSKLSFPGANDSNSLLVDLDVTKKDSIDKAFDAAVKKFKRIDVVVNNAGYETLLCACAIQANPKSHPLATDSAGLSRHCLRNKSANRWRSTFSV
jgi:NAD(P)-dependent dehydrogenase (short-subunit alcohol dehydrogenase family)